MYHGDYAPPIGEGTTEWGAEKEEKGLTAATDADAEKPMVSVAEAAELSRRRRRSDVEKEIGVYWYLFSNLFTCECIHKRVIKKRKSSAPSWRPQPL
jgi:hypothetical protein